MKKLAIAVFTVVLAIGGGVSVLAQGTQHAGEPIQGAGSVVASSQNNRTARPTNPAISSARAVEIAAAHLASQGIRGATFRSSKMDWERGRWVWEVEFRHGRITYEFYIDVNTGAIVKFEIDR